jgi:hypothetical protein
VTLTLDADQLDELVAVADLAGGAIIATVDPSDMNRLAANARSVITADIGHD